MKKIDGLVNKIESKSQVRSLGGLVKSKQVVFVGVASSHTRTTVRVEQVAAWSVIAIADELEVQDG